MANEAEILENPTSTPAAVSTGYQRQNTNSVASRVGVDNTVVTGGTGQCTVEISGPVDVNGVLYTVQTAATLSLSTEGRYFIYLDGSGATLTPTLTTDAGTFDADKNARYTSGGYRILNWIVYYDGTTSHISKLTTPFQENNRLLDIDEPEEETMTSMASWTAKKSKYYVIWVTGRGGDGGRAQGNSADPARAGGGSAAGTGYKRVYIEAGDTWTSSFSVASLGNTLISDGTTTISAINGKDADDVTYGEIGEGGASASAGSGFDVSFRGGDGNNANNDSGGNGGPSYYGGGGRGRLENRNGYSGSAYGSGGGGAASNDGFLYGGGSGGGGFIRIIG